MKDANEILVEANFGSVLLAGGWNADAEAALRRVGESLNGADAVTRESARVYLIESLKAAGIAGGARLVSAALGKPEPSEQPQGQGRAIVLSDPEPWHEPVDGATLLDDLSHAISARIVTATAASDGASLWTIHAHGHDAASISPILTLFSPEKRCGKTSFLAVLQQITPRPLPASNATAAALFRLAEKCAPTVLLDECDTFLTGRNANEDLRGLVNSGHRKSTAVFLRCDGPDNEAKAFKTWSPKAIALIGTAPDTIRDRSILISMRRKTADERVTRLVDDDGELLRLCQMAARWTADNLERLRLAEPLIPDGLNDRAADNWRPLLAIADLAGGDWPQRARKAALELSGAGADEDVSIRIQLLKDIKAVFGERSRMASADLTAELVEMEGAPWPEWKTGNRVGPISPTQLARLLKPFGITPKLIRFGSGPARGYEIEDFSDSFGRYLSAEPLQPLQPNTGAGFEPKSELLHAAPCNGSETAGKPHKQRNVTAVTVQEPGSGEKEKKSDPDRWSEM